MKQVKYFHNFQICYWILWTIRHFSFFFFLVIYSSSLLDFLSHLPNFLYFIFKRFILMLESPISSLPFSARFYEATSSFLYSRISRLFKYHFKHDLIDRLRFLTWSFTMVNTRVHRAREGRFMGNFLNHPYIYVTYVCI